MAVPVDVEQSVVSDDRGIVVYLNGLTVIAQVTVGGVRSCAPSVADTGADNAGKTPELGVGTPESAQCKGCRLGAIRCVGIDGRCNLLGLSR